MGIFKEYDSGGRDRTAQDKRRHRELVEESIKKNIGSIIAEESIIGQDRNKKIKIPIRSIKEYRFVYSRNSAGAASGDGDEKRGDIIGEDTGSGKGAGQGAGSREGEDIYETEVTIEELVGYLLDDLELPDMDRKKLSEIERVTNTRNLGYKRKGITARLAKKRSAIEKIKRKQAYIRTGNEYEEGEETGAEEAPVTSVNDSEAERFPFIEDDLRYHRLKEERKKDYNAVVICIMDVSGSMDQTKKYMARSFYFLLYQFIRLKYTNVEVVFIAHTTVAREVNEKDFFHRGESGGTYISSGYEKALEVIEQRYNPQNWNIYAFHCSDGDNWTEDNRKAIESAERLCEVCNLFGYCEIVSGYYSSGSTIKTEFLKISSIKNLVMVTMAKKDDIHESLKKILNNSSGGLI